MRADCLLLSSGGCFLSLDSLGETYFSKNGLFDAQTQKREVEQQLRKKQPGVVVFLRDKITGSYIITPHSDISTSPAS